MAKGIAVLVQNENSRFEDVTKMMSQKFEVARASVTEDDRKFVYQNFPIQQGGNVVVTDKAIVRNRETGDSGAIVDWHTETAKDPAIVLYVTNVKTVEQMFDVLADLGAADIVSRVVEGIHSKHREIRGHVEDVLRALDATYAHIDGITRRADAEEFFRDLAEAIDNGSIDAAYRAYRTRLAEEIRKKRPLREANPDSPEIARQLEPYMQRSSRPRESFRDRDYERQMADPREEALLAYRDPRYR